MGSDITPDEVHIESPDEVEADPAMQEYRRLVAWFRQYPALRDVKMVIPWQPPGVTATGMIRTVAGPTEGTYLLKWVVTDAAGRTYNFVHPYPTGTPTLRINGVSMQSVDLWVDATAMTPVPGAPEVCLRLNVFYAEGPARKRVTFLSSAPILPEV